MRTYTTILFLLNIYIGESLLDTSNIKQIPECSETVKSKRVFVLGAGMAGLSAASFLVRQGFSNVTIVEANDRIGGRIDSVHQQTGGVLEYGAQWLRGEIRNPLYRIAYDNNLIYEGAVTHPEQTFHTIDGKQIPTPVVQNTIGIITDIITQAETLIDNLNGIKTVQISDGSMRKLKVQKEKLDGNNEWFNNFQNVEIDKNINEMKTLRVEDSTSCLEISFGSYMRTMFRDNLKRTDPPAPVRKWMEELYGWRMRWENTRWSCPSLDDVSFPAWNDYESLPGDVNLELGDKGYGGLLDVITEISASAYHLNESVQKIQWKNGDGTVKITVSDGKSYIADNLIVTASLGHLKNHHQVLFEPELPLEKVEAIERLGYGTVDKIFLFFEVEQPSVNLAWHDTDDFQPEINGKKYDNPWYRGLYSFNRIFQQPKVMLAFIAGNEAIAYESTVSDEEALEVCHQLLKKFSGNQDFPRPNSILRTKWYSDKYANGSYSYRKVGSTMKDSQLLAEPVHFNRVPVLLFAGEATHPTLFSTTTGAYKSGRREAERLYSYYCPLISPSL